jgi:hypothetical protein
LPQDLAEYRDFYWPESMERGDLPWDASAAALELLGFVVDGETPRGRPSARLAKQFWRVTLAAPDATADKRLQIAALLSMWTANGQRHRNEVRGIEWYLAFAPWRSARNREQYDSILGKSEEGQYQASVEPIPPLPKYQVQFPDPTDPRIALAAFKDLFGSRAVTPLRNESDPTQRGQEGSDGQETG